MSTTAVDGWGRLDEPTDSRWQTQQSSETLRPYRVRYQGELYSQEDFLTNDSRYYNFTSGIGAGKTISGIMRTAANVERWNPGEMGMIIAPTVPALKNTILPKFRRWGFLDSWDYYGPQSEQPGLHAPNGARVLLESANNERKIGRLRGPDIAWFWIDEAAQVPRRAWDVLVGRLRAGNYRNGFITTTPKGHNWVYDRFHPDGEDYLDDVTNVLGVPSYANPHNPDDYGSIVDEYSGHFYEQEVLGEFTKPEGLIYPWFKESHIRGEMPGDVRQVIYGVDWGGSNPNVILAVGRTPHGYVVLDEFYEARVTDDDLIQQAQVFEERYRPGPVYCDPAEPRSIEAFQRAGLDARKAINDVTPGIKCVTSLAGELEVRDVCQNVINEFGLYRYEEEGGDPVSVNDHAMDALRYALFSHEREGGWNTGVAFG